MVEFPAASVSDYNETKTIFLLQILAEKLETETDTETETETQKSVFSFLVYILSVYSKTKQDIGKRLMP